eukprot:4482923-Alexandrium_andersonii.AAC.1
MGDEPRSALASLKIASPVGVAEGAKLVLVFGLKCDVGFGREVQLRSALKVPKKVLGLAPAVWSDVRSLSGQRS